MKTIFVFSLPLLFIFCLGSRTIALGQDLGDRAGKYKVVINHEEQYSIWPANKKTLNDWKDTRMSGSLKKCQDYIEEVWTDMRPLSVRKMKLPKGAGYMVVINHEEQYSIWPVDREVPSGWKATRMKGELATCQKYIEEVWTDMRPLSLRNK